MSTPLSTAVRRKKVFARPRSTSGCLTCKSRRVKCDETKPTCLRCLQFETDCAGYETREERRKPRKVRADLQPLLPCMTGRSPLSLLQPSRDLSFQSEAQGRYFLVFRDEVVPELTGVLSSSLWNCIILQACHSELFVRKAVIALAALRMSLSSTCVATPTNVLAQHYNFALAEYGKAIREMREALSLSEGESGVRKALIGCLLVFCFESFQGNQKLAISHAKYGYQLLQHWLASKLSRFARAERFSSPEPEIIEEDLLYAFYRLDIQIMTVDTSRPIELHSKAKTDGASVITHMPMAFSDLNEAYRHWVLVIRRSNHFIHSALAETRGRYSQDIIMNHHGGPLANIGDLTRNYYPSDRFALLQTERSLYATELMHWQTAFKALLLSPDGRIHPGAALMQIHTITSQVSVDMLATNEDDFQKYTPKFREIMMLARSAISPAPTKAASKSQSFSIDIGIIPSLLFLLYLCQDEALCLEARSILFSSQRREGVWDSVHLAQKIL